MIHLDIKPDNILYTINDKGLYEFKFGDFGLAKSINSGTTTFGIGTQHYGAPEQSYFGTGKYTNRVDI